MNHKNLATKLFWSENQNKFVVSTNVPVSFNVKLGRLLVGTLEYDNQMWHFKYSEDFKNQKRIVTLVNFPYKEKTYESKELWPFFASRIPSNAQLQAGKAKQNIVDMLQQYGRRTVANPYKIERAYAY